MCDSLKMVFVVVLLVAILAVFFGPHRKQGVIELMVVIVRTDYLDLPIYHGKREAWEEPDQSATT